MKLNISTSLLACSVVFPLLSGAQSILTPQAAEDYSKRLSEQPEIAARIAIPLGLKSAEEDALKFLYAYIPTPDAVDMDGDFFLENVRLALQAREEMPWGKKVPDREWRHFVLPVRVNNENPDNSRKIFYEELKERVKGLSMKDAILEVNHWCHEKVSYQPSDARTSSPLATVCNALGRCGEESTFTVAALRSIGIPARQVYTPRWAHTDDNHAWVEAWADGEWYFLGACEPEAVLNLAWFNAPASRGMLMTTNVYGSYDGPEEQIATNPLTTVINVTRNYAPVVKSGVFVTDSAGTPVENAKVRFSLYNYAEFYPLTVKHTDKRGYAEFTSGKGDLLAWGTDGTHFNFSKLTAGDTIRLVLDKDAAFIGTVDFDLTPPPAGGNVPVVDPEASALNDRRKAQEDSIRLSYVNTFISPARALEICRELELDSVAADLLVKSRGNHGVIESFLRDTSPALRKRGVNLLGAIAEKDLHDVSRDVLDDNLMNVRGDETSPLHTQYVLNPRVEVEMLYPYKNNILSSLSEKQIAEYSANPHKIEQDLKNTITPDTLYNPGHLRQSPVSTLTWRRADALNRSIAFVAICRSIGVPARIDPVTGATQFADKSGNWQDVTFGPVENITTEQQSKNTLKIENNSPGFSRQPKYYSQFSLSRIVNGEPELMEFDDFESLESINNRRQPISEGQYLLVTGQRLANGAVLARANFFRSDDQETLAPEMTVRQDTTALQVIGSLDAELTYTPLHSTEDSVKTSTEKTILSTTGRGYYVLGLIAPGHEPSAHALNDIASAAEELESTGRKILILFPDAESAKRFRMEDYGKLPPNVVFGIDNGGIAGALCEGLEFPPLTSADLPFFVVADTFNRVIFAHRGYTIRLGETLAATLRAAEK
ncbi:MAG: transglutaminase-like domain-containing protein [Muribaculaceae bacterium]|nr:transglutaminase-like domain-containing protein [Muribaculaceae bacterium]